MKDQGFKFVSLDEAVSRIGTESNEERFAAITLDDGFRDNLIEALPVFEKHGTPLHRLYCARIDGRRGRTLVGSGRGGG